MQVKVIRSADDVISAEFAVSSLKQILSGLELHHGRELVDSLMADNYRYILINSANPDGAIALQPEVAFGSLEGFDLLVIVRDIDGEIPVIAVAAVLSVSATSFTAIAATALINIALSFALNAVMSLLSPTPEFNKDPAKSQELNSNLFNGAVITREQGGIVPLILGNPFCGGVLISSGISTEDF